MNYILSFSTYVPICWSRNIISVTVTPVPRGRATIDLVKAQGPTGTSREDPDQTNRDQQAGTLVRDQQGGSLVRRTGRTPVGSIAPINEPIVADCSLLAGQWK